VRDIEVSSENIMTHPKQGEVVNFSEVRDIENSSENIMAPPKQAEEHQKIRWKHFEHF